MSLKKAGKNLGDLAWCQRLGKVGGTAECRKARRPYQISFLVDLSIDFPYEKLAGKVRNRESCDQLYVQTVISASYQC